MSSKNPLVYKQIILEILFEKLFKIIDKCVTDYEAASENDKEKIEKKLKFYKQFFGLTLNSLTNFRKGLDECPSIDKIFESWNGEVITYHDAFFNKDLRQKCYYYCNECKDEDEVPKD